MIHTTTLPRKSWYTRKIARYAECISALTGAAPFSRGPEELQGLALQVPLVRLALGSPEARAQRALPEDLWDLLVRQAEQVTLERQEQRELESRARPA